MQTNDYLMMVLFRWKHFFRKEKFKKKIEGAITGVVGT